MYVCIYIYIYIGRPPEAVGLADVRGHAEGALEDQVPWLCVYIYIYTYIYIYIYIYTYVHIYNVAYEEAKSARIRLR